MLVNMKISFVLVCTCAMFSIKRAHGSAIGAPFYPLDPEDLSEGDIKELEYWDKYYHRPKRTLLPPDPISGSAGILTHLTSAAIAGAKHKIGAIASGSAGAVAGSVAAASTGAKHAIGAIASGSAGAVAGSLAAASTGAKAAVVHVGKSVGGAVAGSAGAINLLKAALLTETKKKIVGVATGVATGAAAAAVSSISGSASAIKSLKTAALTGISKKIGQIASGSAKAVSGGSAGIGLASGEAVKHIKNIAVKGLLTKIASGSAKAAWGLATAGVSAIGQSAYGVKGAVFGSANFFHQLKSALVAGITKHIGLIAAGSVKAATGASLGIKTKLKQVSGDIAAGSADVIGQLKHAVVAGTKKKLGQAASGLAGALTGAVGSASAGAGQLARGVFIESSNLVNNLKTAVVLETKNKIGQIASGSAGLVAAGSAGLANKAKGAIVGSASAITQVKAAALAGVAKKIGQVASASVGAAAGTAFKASSGFGQAGVGSVKGTIDTINQIKSAAIAGVATKIGQAASLSAGAVAGTSGHIVKSATKLKTAAISGTKDAIGALASGSVGTVAGLSKGKFKRSVGSAPVEPFLDLPKRSESAWSTGSGQGSADIINQLKSAVVSGLKKKIGQVAKGSAGAIAGASAGFSKGSFGGDAKGYHPHTYEPSGPSYDHKPSINVWELKKSVLNTLLQAVKAIKGGVLAIKGQLIKGSGYVVAGSGNLLAAGGDKVTSLGKNIISNAILVHPHKEHQVHSEYGHPSAGYTAPSGPPIVYDSPPSSGPSYEIHYESSYDHHNDKPPNHAGILILKRIPSTKDTYHTSHSNLEESRVPAFKPLAPTGPSFGNVIGKFFTASTSLDTSQPTPFGDTAHGEAYGSHGESHYPVEHSHAAIHHPAPPYYEEPRTKFEAVPPPNFQVPLIKEHKVAPTSVHADFDTSIKDFGGHVQPPLATNYDAPFEDTHNFLNINDHLGAEASNTNEQKIKLTKGELLDHLESSATLASSQIKLPRDAPQSLDALKSALKSNSVRKPSSSEFVTNGAASGEILSKPPTTNYALYHQKKGEKHSSEDLYVDTSLKYSPTYARFKKAPSKSSFSQNLVATRDNSLEHFLPTEQPRTPFDSKEVSNGFSSAENYHKYLEHFPFHKVNPTPYLSTSSKRTKSNSPLKLRMQSDHRQRRPSNKGGYSVVKSVSYEITPDGAKRLT